MSVITCPSAAELERLVLGGLHEPEAIVLEQHVLECRECLEMLKKAAAARETLSGLRCDDTFAGVRAASPVVADLMLKLESLRPTPKGARPVKQGTRMLTIACQACQQKFVVTADGEKEVACPECGQPTAVAVLPPDRAEAPSLADASNPPTHPPMSKPDVTQGLTPALTGHDSSLTAFLAPRQTDDELGRLGKYRVLKILGYGGMGVVFKAEDSKLKRMVAIKAMLPALAASVNSGKRFLREAEAMAKVEHDHIVRIYQCDEERGIPFMAMEFLKGETLEERLQRDERLPLADVLRIGREIADGLAAAHATGLIHRDIKPANIWLEAPRQRVKILDFGLARAASQDTGITQQGSIIGTPAYMAPEQGRGENVDGRCDLFSLGVILYRLCTGNHPFNGSDTVSTLMAVALTDPIAPLKLNADLPQALSDLVMKLLEKNPERRSASAAEVSDVLQALEAKYRPQPLHDATETVRASTFASTPTRAAKPPRRSWALLAFAACALLTIAAGAVYYLQTNNGIIRIDINDPKIKIVFDQNGPIITGVDKNEIKLTPGAHGLHVQRGDLEFTTEKFLLKRGETITLEIQWIKDGKLQVVKDGKTFASKSPPIIVAVAPPPEKTPPDKTPPEKTPADKTPPEKTPPSNSEDVWRKHVATLPAREQLKMVAARLQELNKGYDGKIVSHKIDKDGVVTELVIWAQHITDISPLRALTGLQSLSCGVPPTLSSPLADLSPLRDLKLTKLAFERTKVANLTPLKDMPLTVLNCSWTPVDDLTLLKGMPLTELNCQKTKVTKLGPLKDLKLTKLDIQLTQVADLSALQNLKLVELNCAYTKMSDLDLIMLKDMPLTHLSIAFTRVSDLGPLKDLKLTYLHCGATAVSDLTPLKDMKLTTLICFKAGKIEDLSPLKGMPLTVLQCYGTKVTDLSVLRGMPLTELKCDFEPERDAEVLRSLPMLKKLNDKPPAEVLK